MTRAAPMVLVVDDKRNMLRLLAKILRDDAEVRTADSAAAAIEILEREHVDAVVCDLRLPDATGLDVFAASRRLRPHAPFILMTAYATVATAVTALKQGAFDYLTKPIGPDAVRDTVRRALDSRGPAVAEPPGEEVLPGIHARSHAMLELADVVRRLAGADGPILLCGPSGVGKRRLAHAIHRLSARAQAPLLEIDPTSADLDVLRDAVARASAARPPMGPTVYAPAIETCGADVQAWLERAIEAQMDVAGEPKPAMIRLVGSIEGLGRLAEGAGLRRELSTRLSLASVSVPPLRARPDDIPVLARRFLAELEPGPQRGFSPGVMETLVASDWPGNVRQLEQTVRHAAALATGRRIELSDLPVEAPTAEPFDWASLSWAQAQARGREQAGRRYLEAVLRRSGGDVPAAAARAGVERESFYRLLRRHGIEPEVFRGPSSEGSDAP